MRIILSLSSLAHDAVLPTYEASNLPPHLQRPTATCRICKTIRNADKICKNGICPHPPCRQKYRHDFLAHSAIARELRIPASLAHRLPPPTDCRFDPCQIMQCMHCTKQWGCRQRCDSSLTLSPCYHQTNFPDSDHALDRECFGICYYCHVAMCPEIMISCSTIVDDDEFTGLEYPAGSDPFTTPNQYGRAHGIFCPVCEALDERTFGHYSHKLLDEAKLCGHHPLSAMLVPLIKS